MAYLFLLSCKFSINIVARLAAVHRWLRRELSGVTRVTQCVGGVGVLVGYHRLQFRRLSVPRFFLPYSCIPVDLYWLELPMILDCESEFSRVRSFPIEYVLEIPCMRQIQISFLDPVQYSNSESSHSFSQSLEVFLCLE